MDDQTIEVENTDSLLIQAIEDHVFSDNQKIILKKFGIFDSYITTKDITDVCKISKQAAYQALQKLMKMNLVTIDGKGKSIFYKINHKELNEITERYIKKQELR